MSKLLLLLLLLVYAPAVFGTGQDADNIIYKGTERMLFSNPLKDYYRGDPGRRPNFMVKPLTMSSGNWRGYVATWEIVGGKLFLTKVDSWFCSGSTKESCHQVALSELFPGKVSNQRVYAEWYSGELRVPDGELLQYVHMGYGSTYERDLIFNVKKGVVSGPKVIDNTKGDLPSEPEAALKELQKLKESPVGNKPAFGAAQSKASKPKAARGPKSGIVIVPGQGVFAVGTRRMDLEAVVGDGESENPYKGIYFVEYPKAGLEVSYESGKNTVHIIFLYNGQPGYENFVTPKVKTDKGIDWNASPEDILKAYGKPLHDYQDESPAKSWRRLEYPGIDFLFESGRLGRIGILGPDGN
jgi:hypothetical protein